VWDRLWPVLSKAQTEEDVIKAVEEGASPYAQQFVPSLSNLILRVVREPKFPKRRKAQINFLADSLAGVDRITLRYSRDICQKDRAKQKRAHHILRYEVYVECSCGHKGLSRNHACPKCEAEIDFGFAPIFAALS
jgi:ribosomal protein L32